MSGFQFGSSGSASGMSSTLFGGTSTVNPQQSGGFLFGQSSAAPSTTGFQFGQSAAAPSTAPQFGQPSAAAPNTGFQFGQSAAAPSSTGFQFGQSAAAPSTGPQFGQPSAAAPSTGFQFGQSAAAPSSGFQFGQPSAAAPSTGFQFGQQSSAAPSTGFQFGQSAAAPSTGFQFGQSSAPTGFATGSSLFGGVGGGSTGSGLFGSAPTAGSSLFAGGAQPAGAAPIAAAPSWEADIKSLIDAYDSQSPNCRFQYVLYNKSENPAQIQPSPLFTIHSALWHQAIRDNPDPNSLVPVPVLGFDTLRARLEQQDKARQHYLAEVQICQTTISKIEEEYDVIHKVTIPECRQRHTNLALRLLQVVRHLDIQQGRGYPRSDAELRLSKELETLDRLIEKQRISVEGIQSGVPMAEEAVSDQMRLNQNDPNYKRIYEFLDQQRQAIRHLIELLQKDIRDCTTMHAGYVERLNPGRM